MMDYEKLKADNKAIEMIRPFWTEKPTANPENVTVVICQGNRRDLTELCVNSLLRFYPDIDVLVVNGSPFDADSTNYLKLMEFKHSIRVFEWAKTNAHGVMMDTAIRTKVKNEYVLLLDNDTIIERGGFIEGMLDQLQSNPRMFATGTLMLVTRSNDSCGFPTDESDVLRHAHPSCSLIKRSMYLGMRPATDHGAPLCYTMADAEIKGYEIASYPVDKYVSHLSGASWTNPRTIWNNDHDVSSRPFVTFVISTANHLECLGNQSDRDFDMLPLADTVVDSVVIHGSDPVIVNNRLFGLRFRVKGEYVCVIPPCVVITSNYVDSLRRRVVENRYPDRITIGGLEAVRRDEWQGKDCL